MRHKEGQKMISELLIISVGAILINNFVLVQFLGICPFLGVSKKVETASGMGFAVVFVMICASALTWLVQEYLLIPFGIEYMQTIAFILVIAVLVQFVEMFLQKSVPSLYNSLGVYLPLITTNCAVLGVAINNITKFGGTEMSFVKSIVYGGSAGLGFTLAIVLFAGVRERLETSDVPEFLKGMPIVLVTAALLSIAFLGFSGLSFN
jgi:electron transport complex protein RnfA